MTNEWPYYFSKEEINCSYIFENNYHTRLINRALDHSRKGSAFWCEKLWRFYIYFERIFFSALFYFPVISIFLSSIIFYVRLNIFSERRKAYNLCRSASVFRVITRFMFTNSYCFLINITMFIIVCPLIYSAIWFNIMLG